MIAVARPIVPLLLLPLLVQAVAAVADGHLDVDYAELQPLAAQSILLDVTRIDGRLVAVGERGHVVYSENGRDWQQAEHVPTRSTLTTVVAVSGRLYAGGHDAVIITSGDGGATWSLQFFDPERQQAVMDMLFTDAMNGVATGSYGLYLVTADGGRTWSDETVDPDNEFHLNSIVRFPDGRRMIAGEAGLSYRSFDDGATWELLDLPYQGSMWAAEITHSGCVVFVGLRGHAMESCDFGESWTELETGTLASLSDVIDRDGMLVMAGNSGAVLTRAGSAVSEYTHSSGVDFAAVLPLADGRFLLTGEDGVHFFPEADGGGADE